MENSSKIPLQVPVSIEGVGFKVPNQIVTNEDIVQTLNTTAEWIVEKTGIQERRFLEEHLVTSDLAVSAAEEALMNAGIEAKDVDVILLTTASPDQRIPSTALIVKEKLGAINAMPFDFTQLGCAAGTYAMYIATHLLQNPTIHNVLVISSEVLSRITSPQDRNTRMFFGDAAGAVVMQKSNGAHGILSFDFGSKLDYAVKITSGGTNSHLQEEPVTDFLQMNGRAVWKLATNMIPESISNAASNANLELDEIDYFILHQANLNIIDKVLMRLNIPREKGITTIEKYGNTGSASIFSCLYELMQKEEYLEGENVLITAIGAGFFWGSLCLKIGKNK